MAGSSRDVELVIRARDEATKAVQSVADALNILAGAQSTVSDSAQKTDGILGDLASAMSDLQKQATGLQALGTVAKQIDRAAEAVQRLENASTAAGQAAAGLAQRQAQLAEAGGELNASVARTRAELEQERAALAQAEAQHERLTAQMNRMGQAYRNSHQEMTKAKQPTDEMKNATRGQRDELIALTEQHNASEKALESQRGRVAELGKAYGALGKEVTANATAQERLGRETQTASDAYGQAQERLEKARAELAKIREAGEGAAQTLGGVALKQDAVAAAAKSTAESLNTVTEAMKRQAAAPEDKVSVGPAATATSAYRGQIQAVQEAKAAWQQAREEATRLGQEMARTAEPSREMNAEFVVARAAAGAAEQAYIRQAQALNTLRGVTQGSAGAFAKVADALVADGNGGQAAARGLRTLFETLPPIEPQIKPLSASLRELLALLFKVPEAADAASGGMRRMGEGGRESLSLWQRLRGEILAITASYIGLYGAMNLVEGLVHTIAGAQAAESRLNVVFGGDTHAAAAEMSFIKGEAERLGFSITQLAGEYTKVAIAGKEMGFSLQGTRTIFSAIAESIRVAGGDASEAEGIFQGLVHSIDRGTLNARNFNNQIGIRIPGAMKAMADAVGVSVQKFDELQRSGGGVAATEDTLIKFAANLRKEMADALPGALGQVNAELGRLAAFFQEGELQVAGGGFADALKGLVDDLTNLLNTANGAQAFTEIGHALGAMVNGLKFAVDNFGALAKVAEFFIGLKVAEFVLGLVSANGRLSGSLKAAQADVRAFNAALTGLNMERMAGIWATFRAQVIQLGSSIAELGADGAIAAAGVAVADAAMSAMEGIMVTVAATARAMWLAVGGFPGLIITGATFILSDLLGKWVTGVDAANDAVSTHAVLLQRVVEDYQKAADGADDFAKKALKSSSVQLISDKVSAGRDLNTARQNTVDYAGAVAEQGGLNGSGASEQKLQQLLALFQQGKISALDFKSALNDLALADPQLDKTVVAQLQTLADKAGDVELKIRKDDAALRLIQGTASDTDKALLGLAKAAETVNGALSTTQIDQYTDALQKMAALDPVQKPDVVLQQKIQQAQQDLKGGLQAIKIPDATIQGVISGGTAAAPAGLTADQFKKFNDAVDKFHQTVSDLNAEAKKRVDDALPSDNIENIRQYIWSRENASKNPGTAANPQSSASGYGQFTDKTWLSLLHELKPELDGLSENARLALRANEKLAADITDLSLRQNAATFARAGVQATPRNQYLGHFLGPETAIHVILANPKDIAAAIVPKADAKANENVFYHKGANGKADTTNPLTVAELLQWASPKGTGAGAQITSSGQTKQEEFDAQVAAAITEIKEATAAIDKSPRDAAIAEKVDPIAKKATLEGVTFGPDQQKQLTDAAAGQFDASAAQREKAITAELNEEITKLTKGEAGLSREQQIAALASEKKVDASTAEGQANLKLIGTLVDLQRQQEAYNKVVGLASQRKDLGDQLKGAFKEGDSAQVKDLQAQIEKITADLKAALPEAKAFAQAMGDQKMIATLDDVQENLGKVKTTLTDTKSIDQDLASGLGDVFKQSSDALGKFIDGGSSLRGMFVSIGNAFRNFAADFLEKIAQMIVQQELLNLLQQTPIGKTVAGGVNSLFSGGAGAANAATSSAPLTAAGTTLTTAATQLLAAAAAMTTSSTTSGLAGLSNLGDAIDGAPSGLSGLAGLGDALAGAGSDAGSGLSGLAGLGDALASVLHGGGIAGQAGGMSRSVWPGVFAGARRMHGGGIAGLQPGEVPTILQKNEEVLTESDPRHAFNAGAAGPAPNITVTGPKIVNAFDPGTVMSEGLNTLPGQKAFINFVRQNQRAINSAMGN
jgi:Tape measure protein